MKRLFMIMLLAFVFTSSFSQQIVMADQELMAEYERDMKLKKAGVTGIVVFGVTWLAGEVICVTEQNRYANDRWDGIDSKEYARLSNEATKLPSFYDEIDHYYKSEWSYSEGGREITVLQSEKKNGEWEAMYMISHP